MCFFLVFGTLCGTEDKNLENFKKKVVSVGKLEFLENVPVRFMSRDRLRKQISTFFDAQYPRRLARKEAEFLRVMGFVRDNKRVNVHSIRKRILLDNASGIYDEKSKELWTLDQYRQVDYLHSMVLGHELRHALQDQHFSLPTQLSSTGYSDFDDRKLALLAAVEGDATFLMIQCAALDADLLTSSMDSDALMSFLPVTRPSAVTEGPDILKQQLLMPYVLGTRFVSTVFKRKKWKGVKYILRYPPVSTEQILHPEKYFQGEKPVPVTIDYKPAGHELYHSGVIGEYYLNILLKGDGEFAYRDAARGWGGDTFHLYQKKHTEKTAGSYFLLWESEWDKAVFGSHFHSDFKRFLAARFNVEFKQGNIGGTDFAAGKGRGDYFFLMLQGNRIFYARSDNRDQMNEFIYGGNYD